MREELVPINMLQPGNIVRCAQKGAWGIVAVMPREDHVLVVLEPKGPRAMEIAYRISHLKVFSGAVPRDSHIMVVREL